MISIGVTATSVSHHSHLEIDDKDAGFPSEVGQKTMSWFIPFLVEDSPWTVGGV